MFKPLISNLSFIAYLFGYVHVLGWKTLYLTLEFATPLLYKPIYPFADERCMGIFL